MISGRDLYTVVSAVVPLYVAMFLAYGSVKWWKIFSPEQCAGINRFVAIFAVPLLSFEFISKIDPYRMNFLFIAADGISKVIVLLAVAAWARCSRRGSLDWVITLFSLSTLPNTLVMGIPLLKAMYGDSAEKLMIQTVVLQCIIWYTLLLFLFEYRSAKKLVGEQYHNSADSQADQRDVLPVNGKDPQLGPDVKVDVSSSVGDDEKRHVIVRKSSLSSISQGLNSAASSQRLQDLNYSNSLNGTTGRMDIVSSGQSSTNLQTPNMGSSFNGEESISGTSSRETSPQGCNDDNNSDNNNVSGGNNTAINLGCRTICSQDHFGLFSPNAMQLTKIVPDSNNYSPKADDDTKELNIFVWSSGGSPISEGMSEYNRPQSWEEADFHEDFNLVNKTPMAVQGELPGQKEDPNLLEIVSRSTANVTTNPDQQLGSGGQAAQVLSHKPSAAVMVKLILDMVCHKLMRNPNTYASVIGMIWALASCRWNFGMPRIIEGSITILSHAGLGMAMFSLGLFMALQPRIIACGTSLASLGMALRFLAGPAAMVIASIAVGLRGTVLHVSIVQAALPQGIVPFVFAREYNLHADVLSTAVIFGMIVSLPITLVYYILLGL